MIRYALYVKLNAKSGKEEELENFLNNGLAIVKEEPKTITWYAIKMGPAQFAIFDTFLDEEGREAHLAGDLAAKLMEQASVLLSEDPKIEKLEIVAAKIA